MPPKLPRIEPAHTVTGTEIDRRLEGGWYRVGQHWLTCRLLVNERGVWSTVWTRVPLDGYRFKKSHRKLLARVDRAYTIREAPAVPDAAHEALYSRYRDSVSGSRSPTLEAFLGGEGDVDAFAARELGLWDGDRLVAFSWFDVGDRAIQSLIGVYDPERASESLGFTTLLLEMRQAMRLGLTFHYAGYVLPGDPKMDFKLRPGSVEFLDLGTRIWRPWAECDLSQQPAERLKSRLHEASVALAEHGIRATLRHNAAHGIRARGARLLDAALYIELPPSGADRRSQLLTWCLDDAHYTVLRAWPAEVRTADETATPQPVWLILEELDAHPRTGEAVAGLLADRG